MLPTLFSEIRLEVDWRKVSFNSTSDNSSTQCLVGKMETRFQYCAPVGVDSRFLGRRLEELCAAYSSSLRYPLSDFGRID